MPRDRLQPLAHARDDQRQRDQREHRGGGEERAAEDDALRVSRLRNPSAAAGEDAACRTARRRSTACRRSSRSSTRRPARAPTGGRTRSARPRCRRPTGSAIDHRHQRRRCRCRSAGRGSRRSSSSLKPTVGGVTSSSRPHVLEALHHQVDDDRDGDRAGERCRAPSRRRGRCRSVRRHAGWTRERSAAAAVRALIGQRTPYFFIGCFAAQPASDSIAAENSSTAAIAKSVASSARRVSSSDVWRIVARQRPRRLEEEDRARRRGSARSRPRRETIASITTSPSARAVASTVPAMSAGRAVRTRDLPERAPAVDRRARASPRASRAGRRAGRRTKIAIISGAIISVRIRTAASRL